LGEDLGISKLFAQLNKADLLLVLILLAASAVSAFMLWNGESPKSVSVYKNNLLWGEFSLQENQIIRIDSHNTLEIKNGKVGMIEADCHDRRCVKQGFGNILPIICLPNQLMVEIHGVDHESPYILY